eukprot:5726670-Pleurochrysis_carterae.AAC.2
MRSLPGQQHVVRRKLGHSAKVAAAVADVDDARACLEGSEPPFDDCALAEVGGAEWAAVGLGGRLMRRDAEAASGVDRGA